LDGLFRISIQFSIDCSGCNFGVEVDIFDLNVIKMCSVKVLIFCLVIESVHCVPKDAFFEELYLKHLPSGHVYAHFQFTTTWNTSPGDENACTFALNQRY